MERGKRERLLPRFTASSSAPTKGEKKRKKTHALPQHLRFFPCANHHQPHGGERRGGKRIWTDVVRPLHLQSQRIPEALLTKRAKRKRKKKRKAARKSLHSKGRREKEGRKKTRQSPCPRHRIVLAAFWPEKLREGREVSHFSIASLRRVCFVIPHLKKKEKTKREEGGRREFLFATSSVGPASGKK